MDEGKVPEKKRKRRSHHKSRNGCLNCKRLRVKCDEQTPKCGNCLKRNRECEYQTIKDEPKKKRPQKRESASTRSASTPGSATDLFDLGMEPGGGSGGGYMAPCSTTTTTPILTPPPSSSGGALDSPFDMELLGHFCANLQQIIMMSNAFDRRVWENYVPSMVLNMPQIAPGLLAMSALHMDKMSGGTRQLTEFAFSKYTETLSEFRSLRETRSTSAAEASFLSSIFVMMLSYVFYENVPLVADNLHGFDLVTITRGPIVVAKNLGPRLAESNVSQIVQAFDEVDPDPLSPPCFIDYLFESCDALDRLGLLYPSKEALLTQPTKEMDFGRGPFAAVKVESDAAAQEGGGGGGSVSSSSSSGSGSDGLDIENAGATTESANDASIQGSKPVDESLSVDDKVKYERSHAPIYLRAIEKLKLSVKNAALNQCAPAVMSWQMSLDLEFLQLARQDYPFAKVILLYHLVAMHALRGFFWIGDRPYRDVMNLVHELGPRWRTFYAWPLNVVQRDEFDLSNMWSCFMEEAGPFDLSHFW